MWKTLWRSLSNERGQEPASPDGDTQVDSSSETTERATEDDSYGVRTPYDENTPDVADSTSSEVTQEQGAQPNAQQQTDAEESFHTDLNLDPSTFTPEMKEIFKRMQAGYTKKMQRFKGFEGQLQNMERFYNDRDFAEKTLKDWAKQNGFNIVPSQFNNQPAAVQPAEKGVNPMQARLVETLKAKLPPETQWMADGQAAAIFEVMKDVLGPVLTEFQGFKTAKEADDWKTLETQYEDSETKFAAKHPGWEAHEEDMSGLLTFLNDPRQYTHPVFGSKHEILFNAITRNANAVKEVTSRVAAAGKNKTPTSQPGRRTVGSGFANIQDEVAATPDRNEAFAKAANHALQQLKRRR